MYPSIALASLMGVMAVATPLRKGLEKKAIVTDIVTEIVYVTVTAGDLPTSTTDALHQNTIYVTSTVPAASKEITSTSIEPPLPPAPTTSSTATPAAAVPTVVASPVVADPAPSTTSTTAPVVVATTSAAPVVVETISSAPVVVATTSTTPVVVATTSAAPGADYISTALFHHNAHRANHSAPAMTWDDTLAGYAKATAEKCVFQHDMTEGGGGYGQNLAAYGSSDDFSKTNTSNMVGDAITNQWYYEEAPNVIYGVDNPNISGPEFLHFTQVVWKSSTKLGCATAQCGDGTIFSMAAFFTVCNYASQGNVLGSFISEVGRPLDKAAISASPY